MRIIPVMDLMAGQVVRGIAGRRAEYRPLVSPLCGSSAPLEVARAFRGLGFSEMYLADLDAIAGATPAFPLYSALRDLGLRLLIDAGLRRAGQADSLFAAGAGRVVAGLETLASLEELEILCGTFGPRVIFSLDLKHGQPLGAIAGDALSVAGEALGHGVQAMLVLDLAQVGVGCGTGTEDLCRRLRQAHASLELLAGGGVRDASEVQRLGEAGVDGVLVASALHDGRISPPRRFEDRG